MKTRKRNRLTRFIASLFVAGAAVSGAAFSDLAWPGLAFADIVVESGETKTTADGTGAITVNSGGTFNVSGGQTVSATDYPSITLNGTGVDGVGALHSSGSTWNNKFQGIVYVPTDSLINTDQRLELSNTISGEGTLTKSGSGQLIMMTDPSALNKIVSTAGTIVAQSKVNAINAINGLEMTGGTFQIWALKNVAGNVTFNGGNFEVDGGASSSTGTFTLSKGTTFGIKKDYTNLGEVAGGTNNLNKTGAGTWTVGADVTIGQLNLSEGNISVSEGSTFSGTRLLMRDSDGTIDVTFSVDGGTASFSGTNHRLGHWPNHTGRVTVNSGSFTAAGEFNVGWDGTGVYTQEGGTSTFANVNLAVGTSSFNIEGGTSTIENLYLGRRSTGSDVTYKKGGTANFSGGQTTIGNLYTYHDSTINISDDATLNVTGRFGLGEIGASTVDQAAGTNSTVNQTGGTVQTYQLSLGHWPDANGVYNLSNGTLTVTDTGTGAQRGLWMAVHGSGTFNLSGTGVLNVSQINLNARSDSRQKGTFTMTGGTLNLGSGGFMHSKSDAAYAINLGGGTIKTLNGQSWSSGLNATLTGTNGATTFNATGGGNITWSGNLSGDGGLIKEGGYTLTLGGTNSFVGGITVNAGVVAITGDSSQATGSLLITGNSSNSSVSVASGAKLGVASGNQIVVHGDSTNTKSMTVAGTVDNLGALQVGRGGTLTVNNGGTWTQADGMSVYAIGGYEGALVVNTGGTFVYEGASKILVNPMQANHGSAKFNINGGTFVTSQGFNSATTSTTSTNTMITLTNNATLRITDDIDELVALGGAYTLPLTINTATIDTNGFDLGIGQKILGSGTITKTGEGTLTISNSGNTAHDYAVTGGTLVVKGGALSAVSSVSVTQSGVFDANELGTALDNYTLAGTHNVRFYLDAADEAVTVNPLSVQSITLSPTSVFALETAENVELSPWALEGAHITVLTSASEILLPDGVSVDSSGLVFDDGSFMRFGLSVIQLGENQYALQAIGGVPEPASWLLLTLGAVGIALVGRNARRQNVNIHEK